MFALLLIAALVVSAQPRNDQVLRGRALELTDDAGRMRCRINVESTGEVVLRMTDQGGTIRVKLGAGEDGSGMVLLDETAEPGVHLIARREAKPGKKATSVTVAAGGKTRVIAP